MPKPIDLFSPLGTLCSTIFNAAIEAQIGYIVHTDNSYRNRMNLYRFRRENPNPEWTNIQILISPDDPEHDLWLRKLNSDSE